MNKLLTILAGAALAAALTACGSATDAADPAPVVSSTVLQITGAATSGANLESSVAFSVPTTLPSGVTVGAPTLTYAVDAAYLAAANGTSGWNSSSGWVANIVTVPATGKTWVQDTSTADIGTSTTVVIKNWIKSGELYLKKIVVPFSDGSSQTITFQTGAHWVHSVYTPATGAAVAEDVDLAWSYFETGTSSDVNTETVATVAF